MITKAGDRAGRTDIETAGTATDLVARMGADGFIKIDINRFSKRELFKVIEQGLETGFEMAQLPLETATERSEANWRKQDEQPKIFSRHPALQ